MANDNQLDNLRKRNKAIIDLIDHEISAWSVRQVDGYMNMVRENRRIDLIYEENMTDRDLINRGHLRPDESYYNFPNQDYAMIPAILAVPINRVWDVIKDMRHDRIRNLYSELMRVRNIHRSRQGRRSPRERALSSMGVFAGSAPSVAKG